MIEQLIKYQETDGRLKAIEQEIGGSEERKKTASAKKFLDTVNESVGALDKRAKDLQTRFERLTALQATLSDNSKEFAQAIEECEDENGIQYLQKKADEVLIKLGQLEAELTAAADEMNSVLSNYLTLKKRTMEAKKQYSEYGQKYKELKAGKESEMKQIESELLALEKDVEPELMQKYKAKRKDKMYPILFAVNDKLCSHCRMELSMAEINRLGTGEIIECDNCRCLIYKQR